MAQGHSSGRKNQQNHDLHAESGGLVLSCELPRQLSWSAYRSAPAYFAGGIAVSNASTESLTDLQIAATSSPSYFQDKVWSVPKLLPGEQAKFGGRDLEFNETYIESLQECSQSTVTLQITGKTSQGEQLTAKHSNVVTLLSENDWNGFANMGELLPIFVRSADKSAIQLVKSAFQHSPDKYFQGYRNHTIAKITEAVYCLCQALAQTNFHLGKLPGDYHKDLQRLVHPQDIIAGKSASSLDIALLIASMCEHLDLHPIIVLYRQYALAAVWLEPHLVLDALTMTRPEVLRDQVHQDHLLVIDPHCLTQQPLPDLATLRRESASVLASAYDNEFLSAYDINLARHLEIHPLGERIAPAINPASLPGETLFSEKDSLSAHASSSPQSQAAYERLQYNRSRLLNLTPANPLLSLQSSNGAIEGIMVDCASLRQHLGKGQGLYPQSLSAWAYTPEGSAYPPLHQPLQPEAVQAALDNGHIFVDCPAADLDDKLLHLHHIEQSERQAQGISSIHMAFLFVNWRLDQAVNRAPLFLLPLTLHRDEKLRCWTIQPVSSDLWLNNNVVELLRQHYKLDVSLLRPQLSACARSGDLAKAKMLLDQAFAQRAELTHSDGVVLGSFPLYRFQTWMDLERLTASLQSPRMQAIITGVPTLPEAPATSATKKDSEHCSEITPEQLCPWTSDHYQAQVINAAQDGQDLVLISPPGTGKSHTLGNLICNKIGQGKKVLLVTKHRSTLQTVYSLLRSVQLDDFCLNLPSPRAANSTLLEQLRCAWQASSRDQKLPVLADHPFAQTVAKISKVHEALNLPRNHGQSVKEVIYQALSRQGQPDPAFTLSWPNHDIHSAEDLKEMHRLVESLARQRASFSGPTMHVLKDMEHTAWSSKWQNDMLEALHTLREQNDRLDRSMATLWKTLGCTIDVRRASARELTFELCALLQDCAGKPVAFALDIDAAQRLDMLVRLANHADAYKQAEAQLSCAYTPQAWQNLAGKRIPERWQTAKRTWWPKCIFVKRKIVQEIKSGGALNEPDVSNDGPIFDRMCSEAQEMIEINHALRIPGVWHGFETPAADILALERLGSRLRNFVAGLSDNSPELMVALKDRLRTLLSEQPDLFLPEGAIGRNIQECYSLCRSFQMQYGALQRLANLNLEEKLKNSPNQSNDLNRLCTDLLGQSHYWQAWCQWCETRQRAKSLGLNPLLKALDSGAVGCEQAWPQFQRAYMSWWLKLAVQQDEQLRNFNSHALAEWQESLVEEASSWYQALAQQIAAKISASIPDYAGEAPDEDWAALRKALDNACGLQSAANLWTEMPEIITTLTPCLLMTPATVAQFLSSHMEPFDTVILAEASQISVEEGLSACARGKQIIVVGDSQQMSPIFDSCSGQEESILDKFIQKGTEVHMLRHNYQAQDERLMTFANARYYAGEVHTLPAPCPSARTLQQVVIEGEFDNATKTNQAEAEAVVKAIMYRLRSEDPEVRRQSMGVITLSLAQRHLIATMLEQEFECHPELTWAVDGTTSYPPIIVRYIENCQGEYRDVVFLCLTYGWDTEGQFAMNFGPLNRVYGSHLFNVAITRAREEMVVCSNFRAADIHLGRTQTVAIADLKEFLEYMESDLGRERLASSFAPSEDIMLDQVAAALTEKGWLIKRNLGQSPLRLGLVVVDPDNSQDYLACVLSDDLFYRHSLSSQERNFIQPKRLQRLGWQVLRVWSLDWWVKREETLDRLHQSLVKTLRHQRAHRQH